eukprot:TRINITY_DN92939_c0_g1_i1.p1 TRINITY_DN92939_c0_g1~~TRINITY_DN92939_c0_g1_i1.p1  ORF type:complete len:466 (-),score=20.23 TRINITY_DN92939_c0_g1_i1:265-1662(-)
MGNECGRDLVDCCTQRDSDEIHKSMQEVGYRVPVPARPPGTYSSAGGTLCSTGAAYAGLCKTISLAPIYIKCDSLTLVTDSLAGISVYKIGAARLGDTPIHQVGKISPGRVGLRFSAICFWDSLCARYLVAAVPPPSPSQPSSPRSPRASAWMSGFTPRGGDGGSRLHLYDLEAENSLVQDCASSDREVTCMASTAIRLYVADAGGCCACFCKMDMMGHVGIEEGRLALLHKGAVSQLVADAFFVYSAGASDFQVSVWDSDLQEQRLRIDVRTAMGPQRPPAANSISGLVRPSSRWGSRSCHSQGVTGLLFLSVASTSREGLIVSWNLSTGNMPHVINAHAAPVSALAYGPYDNGPLLSAGMDSTIKAWDTNSLQCVRSLRNAGGYVTFITVEPQHRLFTLDTGGWLRVWTLVDEQRERSQSRAGSRSVSPAPSRAGSRPVTPRLETPAPTPPATPPVAKRALRY